MDMTDLEVARAATNMLSRLEARLQAELNVGPDEAESKHLRSLIDRVPNACFLLGVAAGKLSHPRPKRVSDVL